MPPVSQYSMRRLTGLGEVVDEHPHQFLHDGICRVVVVEFHKVIAGLEGDHVVLHKKAHRVVGVIVHIRYRFIRKRLWIQMAFQMPPDIAGQPFGVRYQEVEAELIVWQPNGKEASVDHGDALEGCLG